MSRRFVLVLTLLMTLFTAPALYADNDALDDFQDKNIGNEWVLIKNDSRRNIKTYAKLEDGKRFRSFKVDVIVNSKIEVAARVMFDFDNYTKWYWETIESKLIKTISPTEYYVYMVHRIPFLPDRDVVLHAVVELQKKGKGPVKIIVKSVPTYIDEKPPLVRVIAEDMTAIFTPLPGNKIRIEIEGYVDPGGKVPAWGNNFIQRHAPYSTLLGLLRMINTDEYKNSKVPLPFTLNHSPE